MTLTQLILRDQRRIHKLTVTSSLPSPDLKLHFICSDERFHFSKCTCTHTNPILQLFFCLRIEETWRLWQKFLDDYLRFEDWLKTSERKAALPNSAGVLYTVAKEELKKFEVPPLLFSDFPLYVFT